jgi:hypothetical protein
MKGFTKVNILLNIIYMDEINPSANY